MINQKEERVAEVLKEYDHVYRRKRSRNHAPGVSAQVASQDKVICEEGLSSVEEGSSIGDKIRRREELEKELEALRKGKNPIMEEKEVEARLNLGRMFEACHEDNQGMIIRLMEEAARKERVEAKEASLANLQNLERIAALNTDSEDYGTDFSESGQS